MQNEKDDDLDPDQRPERTQRPAREKRRQVSAISYARMNSSPRGCHFKRFEVP